MRIGFLGPEGTFSHAAVLASGLAEGAELVPLPTNHAVVLAVQAREVDGALAPIENSLEGAVSAVLDALAFEAPDVVITGELVIPVRHTLAAARRLELAEITAVVSHPQPLGQCAGWLHAHLPQARHVAATSTAEAIRDVTASAEPWAAIGPRLAAERYGATILEDGIEDDPDNMTRFVWLAHRESAAAVGRDALVGPRKTSLVFHGAAGDGSPGWLVRCLSELAFRGVNMTKIESRPLRSQLGHYLFHIDCDGDADDAPVAEAIEALRRHADVVRVLGSYAAAAPPA